MIRRLSHTLGCIGRSGITAVVLIVSLGARECEAASKDLYAESLLDFQRYAETIWLSPTNQNAPVNSGYWGDGASGGNGGIRGSCGVAVSYAVLVHAYPAATERAARLQKISRALNYAANTHVSGTNACVDGKQWGHSWQSALWAGSMGLACILCETNLPSETVAAVKRAIADEASYRADIPPASGYKGDTKAEENGWNGNVVALAAAWLSTDTGAQAWLSSAKEYLANTYTVEDKSGDPLESWLSTTTLYPDFSLENHSIYHPTYQMVAGMSMGDSLLMASLCNPAIAGELKPFAEHNVLQVWTNLSHLLLDSGEFAYPSGLDWELHDFEQNSYITWLAAYFKDPMATWADDKLSRLVRYRQIVNRDGRYVGESVSNGFFREAVEARRTAIAWLHLNNATGALATPAAPGPDLHYSPHVKIISHRGSFGLVSLSFGNKITCLIEPPAVSIPTNAFMTTPLVPGIVGLGVLGNPTAASLVRYETNQNGFEAELLLTHGIQGTTRVYLNSNGRVVGIVEVPQTSFAPSANAGSFTAGIENDPLTGGTRRIEWWGGGAFVFTNRSGVARSITNSWVCIDGRYGMTAGPDGYFRYQAASGYNRSGAAQDTIRFFPEDQLGPRYAVWFPGQNVSQTVALTRKVSWSVTNDEAVLSFPGLGTATNYIRASLATNGPAFQAYVVRPGSIEASSSQPSYPPANAVDASLSSFWVSEGTAPGQGPTADNPEWLKFAFDRMVSVSKLRIYPRTNYGPKNVRVLLDDRSVYEGAMVADAPLEIALNPPTHATNAQLLVLSSHDPMYPGNSRNVQVVEMLFYERALPDSYGEWLIDQFSDAQLDDPAITGDAQDPDNDGAANLAEFAMGGNPLIPDARLLRVQDARLATNAFVFCFNQRTNLAGVSRTFECSTNLVTWFSLQPLKLSESGPGPLKQVEAIFPLLSSPGYYRLSFKRPAP